MTDALAQLSQAGVSIWLDDLSRELLRSGDLQRLLDEKSVVGVTTNPTIFASALAKGDAYDDQLQEIAASGKDVDRAVFELTTTDVCQACDVLRPIYDRTNGVDGRVSIEVDPRLAHDTGKTVETARALYEAVDRPNVLIKIPATVEGLPAITQATSEGISVNVTLIFSLDRYRGVMQAYLTGLEQAREAGRDLSQIHSVASFFVSRVDSEYDKRIDAVGTDEAKALRGKAAIANARLAFQAYEEVFSTPRWKVLADDGANAQRPDGRLRRPRRGPGRRRPRPVRRGPRDARRAGAPRHLLRRRDRAAGARGRAEVREELGRAQRHGDRPARPRRQRRLPRGGGPVSDEPSGWLLAWAGEEGSAQLEVTASGAAAEAVRRHVPSLVEERFASRLFAQDATLWGPEAESESAIRLSWVGLARSSRPLVGEVAAIREELKADGVDHVV